MKHVQWKMFILLSIGALVASGPVFAQRNPVRYIPRREVQKRGNSALTRSMLTIPYVVNPTLPLAVQQSVAAASQATVVRPVVTASTPPRSAATATAPVRLLSTVNRPMLADVPGNIPVQDTGTNLTGLQVLQTYFPTWRQELGTKFTKEQLDAVERAFAATDEWMFVLPGETIGGSLWRRGEATLKIGDFSCR